jgi:hypothetical protein
MAESSAKEWLDNEAIIGYEILRHSVAILSALTVLPHMGYDNPMFFPRQQRAQFTASEHDSTLMIHFDPQDASAIFFCNSGDVSHISPADYVHPFELA